MHFEFFEHPVYLYGLKEDLTVRLKLNTSGNVILCDRDTAATYKSSDIPLNCDVILGERYVITIGE